MPDNDSSTSNRPTNSIYKTIAILLFSILSFSNATTAQVFEPLGPVSLHHCIVFPDGRTEVGRITKNGYQILTFGEVLAEKRKGLRSNNSRIRKLKKSIKKQGVINGDKKQIAKWKKAIKKAKKRVRLLTKEIKAIEACKRNENFVDLKNIPADTQYFSPEIHVFEEPFGKYFVGAWAVLKIRRKKVKKGVFTQTSTKWCMQIGGSKNPPPYEYDVTFLKEDICKFIPTNVNCKDSKIIGKREAAWWVTGKSGVTQAGINDAIEDVAISLSERSYFGRSKTRKSFRCNTNVPNF